MTIIIEIKQVMQFEIEKVSSICRHEVDDLEQNLCSIEARTRNARARRCSININTEDTKTYGTAAEALVLG